jgi:hypothetical protein
MIRTRAFFFSLFVAMMIAFMGACSSAPISVTLSPSPTAAVDVGGTTTVAATVANSGKGVKWSLSGPGSLSSESPTSVVYVTPAALLNNEQAIVTATSVADPTKSASVQIAVNLDPQISLQTLAGGVVGKPYSQSIVLTGGTSPFQWSVYNGQIDTGSNVAGAVPDGMKLDPSTGTISGTPTAAGTWFFEAVVTDASGLSSFDGFLSIQIAPSAPAGNPIPFLNQPLVPSAVATGSSSFTLKISGTGFVSGASVNFNGTALTTTFVDNEHLSATVPGAAVASAGTATITVSNPGYVVRSNGVYFQVGTPQSDISFVQASASIQTPTVFGVRAADFNEDGKADLAFTAGDAGFVYLGMGDGTFTAAPGTPMTVPSPPYNDVAIATTSPVSIGDFNNSGHLGFAVGEVENEAAVIFLGNGDGTFALSSAQIANSPGAYLLDLEAGDFNSDGNLDLVLTNDTAGYSAVDLGFGKGAFTTTGQLFSAGLSWSAAVGDFNSDGKLDVAMASVDGSESGSNSGIASSLGKGDGTFTEASGSPLILGQGLVAIVAGDFNGDGKLDLAVVDGYENTLTILLGNGDGTFTISTTYPTGLNPDAIVAVDFNNDGKLDLAIANSGDSTVDIYLGSGNGTFTKSAGSPYPAGGTPYAITSADFNGDGKLDLAVGTGNGVTILLQQ